MPTALKGSKTPLNNLTYIVDVELPAHLRHLVDIAAVLLGSDGRVRSDDDLIFFNNPSCASLRLSPGLTTRRG
jgi:tellurite resistance protein TerA